MPEFSIVLPVKNGARFSPRAVQSILNQKVDVEILWISEFNPTDFGIHSEYVTWHYQKASGIASARNLGLEKATGTWLGFLDADDQFPAEALANLRVNLLINSSIEAIFGFTKYEFLETAWREIYRPGQDDTVENPILGAGLWRMESALKIGPFDMDLETGEDVDWLNRAREIGQKTGALDEITLLKTIHGENLTLQAERVNLDLLKVAFKSILRKRNPL